ncbi:MAG: right-handed parallel beta-helix repeat-containing protein, partial [Anaerolineae bacterium]|nr:right-handed parallel beta-helix repeat-containing protein [Anaerolineae bacterium]
VYVSGTNNVTIANCTIQNFTEQGVYATNSSVTVQNSTIQNPAGASHGIYLLGGSSNPTITGNTIKDALIGIERKDSPGAATIAGNTFTNCRDGVKTISSSPEIYNNYFDGISNAENGVRIGTSSSPNIHDNDFFDYTIGVYLEQSQPSNLKWNNFGYTGGQIMANEDRGIVVNYLTSGNGFLNNKWNNFYDGSSAVDIFNHTSTTLNAQGNYWYSQQIEGNVDSSNPQTSHNNDAGPGGGLGKIAAADAHDATQTASTVPKAFGLEQNFPNPFNPGTVIGFKLPQAAIVTLTIYDLLGRRVRTLISGVPYEAGFHNLNWDGTDDSGTTLASGIYVYRIEARSNHLQASYSESRKLVFTR